MQLNQIFFFFNLKINEACKSDKIIENLGQSYGEKDHVSIAFDISHFELVRMRAPFRTAAESGNYGL